MKKLIAVVLMVTLLASVLGVAAGCSDLMRDGGDSQELVGGVCVWDDNVSTLFVDFAIPHGYADDNWCIAEAHLHIFTDNVTFEDIDVSTNQQAGQEMVDKSGQMGVPVLDIAGEVIVGFDQDKIKTVLGL